MNKFVGKLYVETLALAGGLAALSKGLIRRNRPYVYKPNPKANKKDSRAHHSFFSGHEANLAALSFLSAYLINYYYHQQEWKQTAWIGAFAVSGAVGYLRYATGKHYLSDILAGTIVGVGTGFLVPHMHKNQLPKRAFN